MLGGEEPRWGRGVTPAIQLVGLSERGAPPGWACSYSGESCAGPGSFCRRVFLWGPAVLSMRSDQSNQ